MAHCTNCGKDIGEGVKFCASCGTAVQGAAAVQDAPAAAQHTNLSDAEQNKGMAILAYILFFIPLLTGDHKKSPFVMFHTNQGTVLFIAYLGGFVVLSIVSAVLAMLIGALFLKTGSGMLIALAGLLWPLFIIVVMVLWILGIINAAKGRMKPLPIIGRFEIIK